MNIGKLIDQDITFVENVAHMDIFFDYGNQELTFNITIDEENGVVTFDSNKIFEVIEEPGKLSLGEQVKLPPEELQLLQEKVHALVIKYLMKHFRRGRLQSFRRSRLLRYKLLVEECDKRGISLEELSEATSVPLKALESLNDSNYQYDLLLSDVEAICTYLDIPYETWFPSVFRFPKR